TVAVILLTESSHTPTTTAGFYDGPTARRPSHPFSSASVDAAEGSHVHPNHHRGGGAWLNGSSASRVVPAPGGLWSQRCPPSASTRSLSPTSPDPPDGSAPPGPSSRTQTPSAP